MAKRVLRLPDFLIIGAMKSGTTSLYEYLDAHPEIGMSSIKEPDFFARDEVWAKGLEWYASLFPRKARLLGEASTAYTKFPVYEQSAKRIFDTIPDAKLIYLIREPCQRVLSHKLHWLEFGRKPPEPMRALQHFIDCTMYGAQLERYLKFFPPSRILVVSSEGLRRRRTSAIERIFSFLGVDPKFRDRRFHVSYNSYESRILLHQALTLKAGSDKPKYKNHVFGPGAAMEKLRLMPKEKRAIESALKGDIAKLKKMLGTTAEPWKLLDEVAWTPKLLRQNL